MVGEKKLMDHPIVFVRDEALSGSQDLAISCDRKFLQGWNKALVSQYNSGGLLCSKEEEEGRKRELTDTKQKPTFNDWLIKRPICARLFCFKKS